MVFYDIGHKKIANLYLVSKVKVVFKKIDETNPTFPSLSYNYHFESPLLEVYEDAGLTQKTGEILMDNLSFKED